MKKLTLLSLVFCLTLTLTTGFAQTTVTGHAFAEVVESVSASSQSQSNFTIQRNQSTGLDFGTINIKSGEYASCALLLGKLNLTSANKNKISLETSAQLFSQTNINAINGSESISLQCLPTEQLMNTEPTDYKGDINIVLAYN